MAICEMEPVLSQLERPPIATPREAYNHNYDPLLLVFGPTILVTKLT
jgi:hypothetical protein